MAKTQKAADRSDPMVRSWQEPTPEQDESDLDADTMSEEDLRAQLKAARKRVKALETIKVGGPGRLTHHQDIERLWRLGLLSLEQVEGFQETGQLPAPPKAAE